MNNRTVTLDVREDIRNGREPFSRIITAVAELRGDERLLLIAPFEPVPLFRVMEKQGFQHSARPIESGDWEVLFMRESEHLSESCTSRREGAHSEIRNPNFEIRNDQSLLTSAAAEILEVDARGLEPPQPLITILEALASLSTGADLRARTDRRPMHLYPQLEARGLVGETEEESDGSFITHIRRR